MTTAWRKVNSIKKILNGIAKNNEIIDLKALTDGNPWENVKFLTSLKNLPISNSYRKIETGATSLGDNQYKIKLNIENAVVGGETEKFNVGYTGNPQRHENQTLVNKTIVIEHCRSITISTNALLTTHMGDSRAIIFVKYRYTTISTGIVSNWENVIKYDPYLTHGPAIGISEHNSSDFIIKVNNGVVHKNFNSDTKVEVFAHIFTGVWTNHYFGGHYVSKGIDNAEFSSCRINIKSSLEHKTVIHEGDIDWIAIEM